MEELKMIEIPLILKNLEDFKTRFLFEVVYCSTLNKNIAYFSFIVNASLYLIFLYFYINLEKYNEFRGEFYYEK